MPVRKTYGVRLLRFAFITLDGPSRAWQPPTVSQEDASVSVLSSREQNGQRLLLVCADVPLRALPVVDEHGQVDIPHEERRRGESAIEATANLLSLATGCGRSISSPNLVVAFRADTDDETHFMQSLTTVNGVEKGIAYGRMSVYVEEAVLASLADREDGIALLGEALTQGHLAGRFRELLRVFEQGFAESADRLVPALAEFLALRTRLGYSKTEVKRWVVRLRGPATHADRHPPALEADLRRVVDRMLLAAYEVVLNKQTWHTRDTARRELWTPTTGPLDPEGGWFVMQHRTEAPLQAQLYDPYGAYPLHLGAAGLQLDDRCWPRRGPATMTTIEQPITVVPAQELTVRSP